MNVEIIDELLIRSESPAIGQVPSDLDGEMAAAGVENILERVPGGEDGDLVVESGLLVEPFEYCSVQIGAEFVGVNFGIGGTGEHFIVAGIRKGFAVSDPSDAAFSLVANDLALRGDDAGVHVGHDLNSVRVAHGQHGHVDVVVAERDGP